MDRLSEPRCARQAFTLIELLVVIAIIGILIALLLAAVLLENVASAGVPGSVVSATIMLPVSLRPGQWRLRDRFRSRSPH